MTRKVLSALGSTIGITVIVALVFSLCLWLLGSYLGFGGVRPFEGATGRLVGIAVLWIIALVTILLILLRRQRRDESLADDIAGAEAAPDAGDELVAAEIEEMRGKLKLALTRLRKSKAGRRHLYELPWYVIIGPPGAGKTTAILNSGLQFPLAEEMGKSPVDGVGGTRNCDWWFTDDAVLVDTAGRYTAQESDAEADNAAWLGFLGILKKHRPRQPINGALVAISLSDLSMQDEQTQTAHATAIRRRLSELRERLGVRFPVYVLFTKADLLAGFTEFFEPLGKNERQQVWGFTLPLEKAETPQIAALDEQYEALLARLNEQSLERIQSETDPQRRSLIAGFPLQVASVKPVAQSFLGELFKENRYEDRHFLRGVYFTSGTQEGTPIDRLMMGMARTFGIGRQAIGSGRGTGRSYFLTRLLSDVIFRESGLVSADDRLERRYRWAKRGAIAASILLALGMGALWTRSYLGNRALAEQTAESVASYRAAAAELPQDPIGDTDLPAVVPALNILRGLPGNPAVGDTDVPARLRWGLYQGDVIGTSAEQAYRAALNDHLLPRLLLRLEEQMQGATNEPELLFEALRVYLMLGLIGPMDADLVSEWMRLDWSLTYPGPTREELRADLADHLDALLSQPMTAIELNSDLVDRAQAVLAQMPQAQRVYNGIIKTSPAIDLPQWRLTDIGGPALSRAMTRSSGKPLSEGVPGIYTYDGFHDVFLEEALSVAQRIQEDSWVLGPEAEAETSEASLAALSRDVLDLYYNDYVAQYDQILGDLSIIPMESESHAAEITNILSGPTSPIANVIEAVAAETRLTEERSEALVEGAEGLQEGAAAELARAGRRQLSPALRRVLETQSGTGEEPPLPGAYVDERFDRLHQLVASEDGQPSQLDAFIEGPLREVYRELSDIVGGIGSGETTALVRFQQQAEQLPGPVQRWAAQIASGSSGITADTTRASINARWTTNVLPFCTQATQGKYPFDRRAQADISIQDFTRLFGPGGLIDTFFQENLAEHVDQSTRPWSLRRVAGEADLGIPEAALQQMQNAAQIREAFFAGGSEPEVSFQLTPEALDPNAQAVGLEIDGQMIGYRHSQQPRPSALTWPGGVGVARILYLPPTGSSQNQLIREGPWGWFRLLDAAEIRNTNVSDRKRIIFNVGGRIAIFRMQSGSVLNPFALGALYDFSCPSSF